MVMINSIRLTDIYLREGEPGPYITAAALPLRLRCVTMTSWMLRMRHRMSLRRHMR